jgi:replication factor C subunit 3/5
MSPPRDRSDKVDHLRQLKIDQRVFVTPSKRKLDVNVVQSNYHIELTPSYVAEDDARCPPGKLTLAIRRHSDVGMYDRVVIQDILKEIAQTQQVDLNAKQKFKGEPAEG